MPTYRFRNNETGEEFFEFMGISEADHYLEQNPNIERLVNGAPMIHSGRSLGGGLKVSDGFNDILKTIKKRNSQGLTKSTIETK